MLLFEIVDAFLCYFFSSCSFYFTVTSFHIFVSFFLYFSFWFEIKLMSTHIFTLKYRKIILECVARRYVTLHSLKVQFVFCFLLYFIQWFAFLKRNTICHIFLFFLLAIFPNFFRFVSFLFFVFCCFFTNFVFILLTV